MDPDGAESKGGTDDVAVEEDFVERVADGRGRLNEEECERNSALYI